jgi:hypothetical protein
VINSYLERYYGRPYNEIPKTPRFYRFKNEILDHFQWARDMNNLEDMTMAEYALHLWEIGPWDKDLILAELDIVRGIPAHAACQSELCICMYCAFFKPESCY